MFLRIENLTKKFGDHIVLDSVSLSVEKGEVVAIIGSSGCGKSTLLRCINGLEQTDGGAIIFGGENICASGTKWSKIRQKIGMVFQNYELFPHLSVLENAILAPMKVAKKSRKDAEASALALLKRVGLLDKKDAMPSSLSGGQKQRVAIVRALCMSPEILLLDEITASLDPEMVKEVLDVVRELASGGMTMLLVTHEMKFAEHVASKIVFLDAGKIAEIASPSEFFTAPKTERAKRFLNIFER